MHVTNRSLRSLGGSRRCLNRIVQLVSGLLLGQSSAWSAPAMEMSADVGGALLYPTYTTERLDTLVSLSNITNAPKAVFLAVRDGEVGAEALSFIIYLMAHDTFTMTLSDLARLGVDDGPGVIVPDAEGTCTAPRVSRRSAALPGAAYQPLLSFEIAAYGAEPDALRSGYIEAIELATIDPALPIDDCETVLARWSPAFGNQPAGAWTMDPADGLRPPSGGLTGYAVLVDVEGGESYQYRPVALKNFRTQVLAYHAHQVPGPILAQSADNLDVALDGTTTTFESSHDAVSAALAAAALSADFLVAAELDAASEVILTLPTYFTGIVQQQKGDALAPFTSVDGLIHLRNEWVDRAGSEQRNDCNPPYFGGQGPRDYYSLVLNRASSSLVTGERSAITGMVAPTLGVRMGRLTERHLDAIADGRIAIALTHGLSDFNACNDHESISEDYRFPAAPAAGAPDLSHTVRGLPIVGVVLTRIRNETLGDGGTRANYGMALPLTRVVQVDRVQP